MTWHIVVRRGVNDDSSPALDSTPASESGRDVLEVLFDEQGFPQGILNSLAWTFQRFGVVPRETARDLLCASIAAYAADARVPRRRAYDRWTRDFELHLAVTDRDRWEAARIPFQRLLRFLTGDHWTVHIHPKASRNSREASGNGWPMQGSMPAFAPDRVCLFSGGLDSFIGALDQLNRSGDVLFLGHHGGGQGPTSVAQSLAMNALAQAYGRPRTPFLQAFLSPPKIALGASELTTRGRSVLFLALGIAVAEGLHARQVVVPENGFISLNVPLTPTRIGSFSTRTTHPHLITLVRQILQALEIPVEVVLPYRFSTKGEMLRHCADPTTLQSALTETISCAHPGAGRFTGEKVANRHCGYCLPCLIRRAAITSIMTDPTPYTVEDLSVPLTPTRGSDLRVCRLALDRYRSRPPRLADLLVAGPLPGTEDELDQYLGVFTRGLAEVDAFLARIP